MSGFEHKPYELRIGVVGVGALGSSVAYWLKKAGIRLSGVFDKRKERAEQIAKLTSTTAFPALQTIIEKVDVAIFCVKDDSLFSIVDELTELYPFNAKHLIHTSGSIPSTIFHPIGEEISYFSIHPMCAIPGIQQEKNPFENVQFGCEGKERSEELGVFLVKSLGGIPIMINPDKKSIYHAGCCFLSNLIISNLLAGERLLAESGIGEKEIKRAIQSLAISSVKGYVEKGFPDALTGPIARDDIGVIVRHKMALSHKPELKLYTTITEYLQASLKQKRFTNAE